MKTTVGFYFLAVAYGLQDVLQKGVSLTDWKTWIVPLIAATLGHLLPDKSDTVLKSESDPK